MNQDNSLEQVKEYEDAEREHELASVLTARIYAAKRAGGEDVDAHTLLLDLVPLGIYEHFESQEGNQKFYVVDGILLDVNVDDFMPIVTYSALYAPHAGERAGQILVHPSRGFLQPVSRPTDPDHPWVGRRFRLVRSCTRAQTNALANFAQEISKFTNRTNAFRFMCSLMDGE